MALVENPKFTNIPAILTFFCTLPDPRKPKKVLHDLIDLTFVMLCASIANCDSWTDVERYCRTHFEWFKQFVSLRSGVPSHDTFRRIFSRIDPAAFAECMQKWVDSLQLTLKGKGVHLDGKTLRHSFNAATGGNALQMVSAWASEYHMCLGQIAVEEGSNELTAVPKLLELLVLDGAVVTLDAMHCQKKTATQIRHKKADYVLVVKENQEKLFTAIDETFQRHTAEGFTDPAVRQHTTTDKRKSRQETRRYIVCPAPEEVQKLGFKDLKTIGMVYRKRVRNGKETEVVVYFISSLQPKVRTIAKHLRDHWSIENCLHWSLDVTFKEDLSTNQRGNGQIILAMFRRLSLSLLKRDTTEKASLRLKRLMASWDVNILLKFLTGEDSMKSES